jgi:hypothetical protein
MHDHGSGKRLAHSRAHSFLIEYQSDFSLSVLIEQAVDLSNHRFARVRAVAGAA